MNRLRTGNSGRLRYAQVAVLGLMFTAQTVMASERAPAPHQTLHSRVDPRVELLSLIFRLAGNPEYNLPNSKSPYSTDVETYFEKFREHPVVHKARELRTRSGVSFDAVMGMAVYIDNVQDLHERIPFDSPACKLDKRWRPDEARVFLKSARDFVRDSGFQKFLDAHQPLYTEAAQQMDRFLALHDPIAWFDSFFGARANASFEVLIGMLNGGCCYGTSIRLPVGQEEIKPVIGVWKFDSKGVPEFSDDLPTLIHEFCHPYTNPIVEKYAKQLQPAAQSLFESKEEQMRRQAYGSPETLLCESLVRACVVRFLFATQGEEAKVRQIREERGHSFEWVGELADLLGEYESARDKYPTFDSFMPRVIRFFNDYTKKIQEQDARKPRVVSMIPANGAEDVNPNLKEMKIVFDRPMRDRNWSIVQATPNFPHLTGIPRYDKERKVLTVGIRLEPSREYELWLNRGEFSSFMSEEGVRLDSVAVTFKTQGK